MSALDWPGEQARASDFPATYFAQRGSNICLDLHGNPQRAPLHVFSDGNHHMALEEALRAFVAKHPQVGEVFYATMPPRLIVEALQTGAVQMGNLCVTAAPHVFISPQQVLDRLVADGRVRAHRPFAISRGSALLVKKGNPGNIHGIADLARADVRIFLSNPVTESVSYKAYAETLCRVSAREGIKLDILDPSARNPRVIYGESIHHREAPQCLAEGSADVAVVFHHLALRYVRIFPDIFDMVLLGLGAGDDQDHVTSALHIGLVGDGGSWGGRLTEFMTGDAVAAIYGRHGLAAAC